MHKNKQKVLDRINQLEEKKAHYVKHIDVCRASEDWHGVEDAGSDVRDIEAQINALEWVLKTCTKT